MPSFVLKKIMTNSPIIGALTIAFGLLYIPAFIYSYFWLWVFPFTGMVVLFTRAMIDAAIERVSQKSDEAVQAKAMILEFLMMNAKMTVLLSLPFITALFFVDQGQIKPLHISEQDRAIWEWCLGVLKSRSKIGVVEIPLMQIVLSNFFFMIVCTVFLFALANKKIKQVFVILFHRESYKFLQVEPSTVGDLGRFLGLLFVGIYVVGVLYTRSFSDEVSTEMLKIVFLVFLIFSQVSLFFAAGKIQEVRWKNIS